MQIKKKWVQTAADRNVRPPRAAGLEILDREVRSALQVRGTARKITIENARCTTVPDARDDLVGVINRAHHVVVSLIHSPRIANL